MKHFEITTSSHRMPCIQLYQAPIEKVQWLRRAVMDNWVDSKFYQEKYGAQPFVQGYGEKDGWILIEFWGREFEKYVDFLNKEYENEQNV